MASLKTLASFLTPPVVFSRAAQLERDLHDPGVLESYHPTPRAVAFLDRVLQAHAGETATGAWTLTGPYGAGKSSCVLFLSALLDTASPAFEAAWDRLLDTSPKTQEQEIAGYPPFVVTARREPLATAVLRALNSGGEHVWGNRRGRKPAFMEKVAKLLKRASDGTRPSIEHVLESLSDALKALHRLGQEGLLLVVDELGLALEFAAHHPDSSDLELLQLLAERAHKPRKGEARLFFVTILHQAFEDYARRLPQKERREWAKVQGRFEDATLVDADLDAMRLVTRAVATKWPKATRKQLESWAQAWLGSGLIPALADLPKSEGKALLVDAYPLDPLALAALPAMSRRFAQNGRTLFSFLASSEGFSLPAVCATLPPPGADTGIPTVALPEVYDFFVEAQNVASLRPGDQALWCEVKEGVERCSAVATREKTNAQDLVRLTKTIGVLQLAQAAGASVRADRPTLQQALGGTKKAGKALSRLVSLLTERGIVVYRRHSESYRIWRGSDFDIEEQVRELRQAEGADLAAVNLINGERLFPPVVAQRHTVNTGTLRYFQCLVCTKATLPTVLEQTDAAADGYLVLVLERPDERSEIVTEFPILEQPNVLLGFPESWQRVMELAAELVGMRTLRTKRNVRSDSTAQREIRERAAEIEKHLRDLLHGVFDPSSTVWYRGGSSVDLGSRRALNVELSLACDEVYSQTPILHNELINRRQLSSTSSAARGALLRAMLDCEATERLGLEGYPPETSMYASVLEATGIHRVDPEFELFSSPSYHFRAPNPETHPNLSALWKAMSAFLEKTIRSERTVGEVFDVMSAPPFGVKAGLHPVLFLACFLSRQEEVAIYEEGTFLPVLTAESLERLAKKPEIFTLRRFGIAGVRSTIFKHFKNLVGKDDAPANIKSLLLVVRPLLSFVQRIPEYTRKTRRISAEAQQIRETLVAAKDPDRLLFEALPRACGFDAFADEDQRDEEQVDLFFTKLRSALKELRDTYENLLGDLRQILLVAFGEADSGAKQGREALGRRASRLRPYVTDAQLTALLMRIADATLGETEWTEALAALILNKPATLWDDHAVGAFELRVSELARRFRQVERLAFELNRRRDMTPENAVRMTFTRANGQELDTVVCRPLELDAATESQLDGLKANLAKCDGPTQLTLLAELTEWLLERRKTTESVEVDHVHE